VPFVKGKKRRGEKTILLRRKEKGMGCTSCFPLGFKEKKKPAVIRTRKKKKKPR